ncbi:DUF4434 domain-containing protein [Xanthobacter sp. DSM 24535]|uniref:DUF4434 domain-containing protein n=1 Tax=Roseixanthobacter psychrophilus TaxID=3119917 RepID=UPI003728F1A6
MKKTTQFFTRRTALYALLCGATIPLVASALILRRAQSRLDGSFLQIWKDDLKLSQTQWAERIATLRALECEDVVLQWTSFGDEYRMSDESVLAFMDLAFAAGLRVTVGLPYDHRYWKVLMGQEQITLAAFMTEMAEAGARFISNTPYSSHPAFAGWYVPYEIDQYSWRRPEDRAHLKSYLLRLRDTLGTKGAPLSISTFFSQLEGAGYLTDVWADVLDAGLVRLMVQDGVGVYGMVNYERLAPLFTLLQQRKAPFDLVLEVFTQLPAEQPGDLRLVPANFERVQAQLEAAGRIGPTRILAFAVYPYMAGTDPKAQALGAAYKQAVLS